MSPKYTRIPADVGAFLREAKRRIKQFQRRRRFRGFIPSDFEQIYHTLRELADQDAAKNLLFCEWGSGFGVVACLAAMLEFDACGIEIEAELVDSAQKLAEDFEIPVEFVCGSYIPKGGECLIEADSKFSWFVAEEGDAYLELGLAPGDFDVIFIYPWPDEEKVSLTLFDRFAADGARLITYQGGDELSLFRKSSSEEQGAQTIGGLS